MRSFRFAFALLVTVVACKDVALEQYNLGVDAIERGDTAAAVEHFESSVRERPSDPDAHFNLGVALYGVGEYKRALEELQIASEAYPDDPGLHVNLAETYKALGRYNASKTEYEYALKRNPNIVGALSGLGELMMGSGQYDDAQEYLLKALSLNPSHGMTLLHLGWLNVYTEKYNEAGHYFFRGLRSAPNSTYGRLGLGRSFVMREKYREALSEYQTVYAKHPRNVEAMIGIGLCDVELGNLVQAEGILNKAIALDPDDARAYKVLADAYAAQEKYAEAVGSYRMATQIKVDYAEAHLGLGRVLEAVGHLEEAEQSLQAALYHAPRNPTVLFRLAQVYRAMDDTNRAETYMEMAIDASRDDLELQRRIRETLKQLRDSRDSEE